MKNQTIILLVVAGACGLVAMLGIKQYMAKQSEKEKIPQKLVLVASGPIKQGEQLTELNTEFKSVDAKACPDDAITDLGQIKDRALKFPRAQGDTILMSQLSEPGEFGAVINIPPGMRVITIPVDATTTHSGMLQPGNRIDLFLTYRHRDEGARREKETTIPLLEYIEVFAVDNQKFGVDASSENAKARHISLLVDIDQAMRLNTAKRKGVISTLLRSSEDLDAIKMAVFSEDDLHGNRTEINDSSALDTMEEPVETPPLAFNLGPEPDIMTSLQAELDEGHSGMSGPVEEKKEKDDDFWTMAIHQGGSVRVEKVNLLSEEPVATTGPSAVVDSPTSTGTQPLTGAVEGIPEFPMPFPTGPSKSGESGEPEEDLEKKAAELLELF